MKPMLLWIPLVACAIPALGAGTLAVTPANLADIRALDEVVITGNLESLYEARKAVFDAQDRFYARFNELNTDDRFDINCSNVAPTGTRIRGRLCVPRIVNDATHDAAGSLTQASYGAGAFRPVSLAAIRATHAPELRKRTLQMIRNDPQLLRALLEHARLLQHHEALREEKFREHVFVWD